MRLTNDLAPQRTNAGRVGMVESRTNRVIGFNEIEYASHTDVGIRRSHNQDAYAVMPAKDDEHWQQVGHVFLVADGMGGHAVGELAAKIAVDNIPHIFSKYAQEGAIAALRHAFVETNSIINTRGEQNREFKSMGTTGIALVLRPEGAWVGHVGDSRAYRVRAGVIEQLSFDHSFLWEIARRQGKNPDELIGIPANRIMRSLGPEGHVDVDVEGPHPLERGDVYLLCSDGLSGQVNDRTIGAVVSVLPPKEASQFLVHLANMQGGPDNITVIVVRVGGEPKLSPSDSQTDVVFPASDGNESGVVTRFSMVMHSLARVPWAFLQLALGIALAGFAIAFAMVDQVGAMIAFIVAVLSILGGVLTLTVQHIRETRRSRSKPDERVLQVYRQTVCPFDAALCERIIQSSKALEEEIRQKLWQYDVKGYEQHAKAAAQHFKQQHFREAFREQCLAMLLLMDTVHLYRNKHEGFKPVWDRPAS
jgi:serine/threonine protein phosphatase PrpC